LLAAPLRGPFTLPSSYSELKSAAGDATPRKDKKSRLSRV
jgi:hypothetical protein